MAREPTLLSIAAPMHDEEDTAAAFYERVVAARRRRPVRAGDRRRRQPRRHRPPSWRELAAADERVKVVTLSRNFGHQAALTAALEHASGDVVVMLDGDLQDPPEVIPEMLDRWREGADVVYAVRSARQGETAFKRTTASWFYRLFRSPRRHRPHARVRRLPADGPRARSTRCWRCPSATASCAG